MGLGDRWIRPRDGQPTAEIDKIDDPLLLGHALSHFKTDTEKSVFSKYCRVSGLSSLCVRQQVLGYRHHLLKTSKITVASKMIYDKGNAYHEWMQNDPAYFGNKRLGWWRCLACGNTRFGRPPMKICTTCGGSASAIRYKEHEMKIEDPAYVSAHPDMLYEVEKNDIRVAEIKSMKHDEWAKLSHPLADNVYQLHGYFCFLPYDKKLPVRVNPKRGLLLYITKADGIKQFPIKAFHVERRQDIVESIASDLRMHKRGIDDPNYVPPVLELCESSNWDHWRAKSCPAVKICKETR